MKHGRGQWPTNAATIAMVDRAKDQQVRDYDRLSRRIVTLQDQYNSLMISVDKLLKYVMED